MQVGLGTRGSREKTLELTQTALINKKIGENFERYNEGRSRKLPPLPGTLYKSPFKITDEEFEKVKEFPWYASLICSLGCTSPSYIAEWPKPELLYARSYLSSYLRRWDCLRQLLYLIGDKHYGSITSYNMHLLMDP